MPTIIDGLTGIDRIKAGSVEQEDLAANVAGKGPAFSAYQNVAQALTAGGFHKGLFQVEEFDLGGRFNNTGAAVNGIPAYAFMPDVPGYYQLNGNFAIATTLANLLTTIYKNGSEMKRGGNPTGAAASNFSTLVYLNGITDFVEMYVRSDIAQNTAPGVAMWFQGFLVRAA